MFAIRIGEKDAHGRCGVRASVKANNVELRILLDSGLSMSAVGEKLGISSATVCRRAHQAGY